MALDADVLPEPERPYESMARRLVCSSVQRRCGAPGGAGSGAGPPPPGHGAVYFCHWGCKQTMGLSTLAKRRLEEAGLPTLVLDGDGCDSRNVADGQMVTRVGAFLEQLEGMDA